MDTRCCRDCGEVKPLSEFSKDRRKPSGTGPYCIKCKSARCAVIRKRPYVMAKAALYARERYQSHKENRAKYDKGRPRPGKDQTKALARRILQEHVKAGKIHKPSECQSCGLVCVTQGHHHDYEKPIDVEWLCPACHSMRHRKYTEDDREHYRALYPIKEEQNDVR